MDVSRKFRLVQEANAEPFGQACRKHLKRDYRGSEFLDCLSLFWQAIESQDPADKDDLEEMLNWLERWSPKSVQSWISDGLDRRIAQTAVEALEGSTQDEAEDLMLDLLRALAVDHFGPL